jgi:tRNA U34 5-methylaminomethyl-2-thiouridine-forming methyltransferase MnmC
LVYFDAFNPDLEPDLWTEEVFKKIYHSMNSNSLLTTYSTKGIVKRALKSNGFQVEKKPGPPGKREILNAWKS